MNELVLLKRIEALEKLIMRQPEIGGVWKDYTPVWTATTTNPSIGNGSLFGRYTIVGKTCTCNFNLTAGSTTTFGSGNWEFSVPTPPFTSGINLALGTVLIIDSGNVYLVGVISFSGDKLVIRSHNNGNLISSIVPMTWVNGDTLICQISYEIA